MPIGRNANRVAEAYLNEPQLLYPDRRARDGRHARSESVGSLRHTFHAARFVVRGAVDPTAYRVGLQIGGWIGFQERQELFWFTNGGV